jgi:ribosome-binding ATPase YchF (GTP1/OBG family)
MWSTTAEASIRCATLRLLKPKLMLADLETLNRRKERVEKRIKSGDPKATKKSHYCSGSLRESSDKSVSKENYGHAARR